MVTNTGYWIFDRYSRAWHPAQSVLGALLHKKLGRLVAKELPYIDALDVELITLESAGLTDTYIGDTVPAAQANYYFEEGNH